MGSLLNSPAADVLIFALLVSATVCYGIVLVIGLQYPTHTDKGSHDGDS